MYEIRFREAAINELDRLDKEIARRIVKKIKWVAENADVIEPTGLKGNLAGFLKLRVGDYRIIYQLRTPERILIVDFIGHRSEVYKPPQ